MPFFWVFGMTQSGIEPRSPGWLANALAIMPMSSKTISTLRVDIVLKLKVFCLKISKIYVDNICFEGHLQYCNSPEVIVDFLVFKIWGSGKVIAEGRGGGGNLAKNLPISSFLLTAWKHLSKIYKFFVVSVIEKKNYFNPNLLTLH